MCKIGHAKGGEAMKITWFDAKERTGQASLTANYITLNALASVPFAYAYKVQVGVDEKGNIAVQPLSKERVLRGDLDEYQLQDIALKKSYSRICGRELMRSIAKAAHLTLDSQAKAYETEWKEEENLLLIKTGKGDN
jgi:hypothetical protein